MTTWLRMEVVQVHAAGAAIAVPAQAEKDGQVELIMPVHLVLVEEEAAMQDLGWTDHTRTEGEDTEETVLARASQVPSLFMAVEEAAVLIMKMLVLGEQVEGVMVIKMLVLGQQVEGVMVLLRARMALPTLEVVGVGIITPMQTARAALAS